MELQNLREGGGGRNGSCISFRKKKILKGKLVVVFSDKQIIDVRRSQLNENIELRNFRELTLSSGETYFLLKSLSLNNSIWTTPVKTAWKKFRELLPVLTSRHLSYKRRGHVYSSCVRSAMLHASETCPLTKMNLQRLQRNDRAMIRQICSIKPEEVATVGQANYCQSLSLRTSTSFWEREKASLVWACGAF